MTSFFSPLKHISLSLRVRLALVFSSLLSLLVVVVIVDVAFDDLEATLLSIDREEQIHLFLNSVKPDEVKDLRTERIIAIYVPDNITDYAAMPTYLKDISVPFSGEFIDPDGNELDLRVDRVSDGHYYFAKNIEPYEQREEYFVYLLIMMTLAILLVTLLMSYLVTKGIVKPLQGLALNIAQLNHQTPQELAPTAYPAKELVAIAKAFNQYNREIHQAQEREQRLVGMASHELRTPIAVITGAIEILERDDGVAKARPFIRLKSAAHEMQLNTDSLLRLSRKETTQYNSQFEPLLIIPEVVTDLCDAEGFQADRVRILPVEAPAVFYSDLVLIKMLLRNLIQNALRHTAGMVTVRVNQTSISIEDDSLQPESESAYLGAAINTQEPPSIDGLGLYIVSLITERLGLSIHIEQTAVSKVIHVDCSNILASQ